MTPEFLSQTNFQILKGLAVALALAFAMIAQHLLPYRLDRKKLVANWRVNFPLALLNAVIVGTVCGGCACAVAEWAEQRQFGLTLWTGLSMPVRVGLSILALDLLAYTWHRANHHYSLLWRFHAVHHSDAFYDASTAVRFHPVEILLALPIRLAVVALLGVPIQGVLLFEVIYAFANLFEHGNTRLSLRFETLLATVFVTPCVHRKHHSHLSSELNSNYATIFTIWDRMAGTYLHSTSAETVTTGLPDKTKTYDSLLSLLAMPLPRAGP